MWSKDWSMSVTFFFLRETEANLDVDTFGSKLIRFSFFFFSIKKDF